jgi:hypothetical protein
VPRRVVAEQFEFDPTRIAKLRDQLKLLADYL